jgi:type II secretory ATPase GspE/PulE/Tfp pilus assembly ATPase PilB-like protein
MRSETRVFLAPPHRKTEQRIGDILLRKGKISKEDLIRALNLQQKVDTRLGTILLSIGSITEKDLLEALSEQYEVNVTLPPISNADLVIPRDLCRELRIIPLYSYNSELVLIIDDPLNVEAVFNLAKVLTDLKVESYKFSLVLKDEFDSFLEKLEVSNALTEIEPLQNDIEKVQEATLEAPVIKIVNRIITKAVENKATDIHFEPFESGIRVRFRIDGILHTQEQLAKSLKDPITTRLKLLAGMNITETRLPQDGRISLRVSSKNFDIRVSTIPTKYGESIVLRLLESENTTFNLRELGFLSDHEKILRKVAKIPYGAFLTTGPTGSGKTTTLYSILNLVDRKSKKVITIENPVEYILEGICQIEVRPEIGLTFANALRSILRQDPDVIMIGEIRDVETAEIATQAALTGHLVLSTLHTNDAISSLSRLQDLGIPSFLLKPSLRGVMAQRLVRRVCPGCSEKVPLDKIIHLEPRLTQILDEIDFDIEVKEGKGCKLCNYTGYKGRLVIAEIIELNDILWSIMEKRNNFKEFLYKEMAFRSMYEDGLLKVLKGMTTLQELRRVVI